MEDRDKGAKDSLRGLLSVEKKLLTRGKELDAAWAKSRAEIRRAEKTDELCLGFWRQTHLARAKQLPGKCHGLLIVRASDLRELDAVKHSRANLVVKVVGPTRAESAAVRDAIAARTAMHAEVKAEIEDILAADRAGIRPAESAGMDGPTWERRKRGLSMLAAEIDRIDGALSPQRVSSEAAAHRLQRAGEATSVRVRGLYDRVLTSQRKLAESFGANVMARARGFSAAGAAEGLANFSRRSLAMTEKVLYRMETIAQRAVHHYLGDNRKS